MSKRSANWQGGEERYGGPAQPEEMADVPKQATAAQLAKRKIAQAKGSRRPRSESPLTNTGSIFEQANSNGMLGNNTMNPTNPFASNNSFTFGNGNSSQTQSFGSGGGSFTFGATSGQNTAQTTPNMNSSFTFGGNSTAPSTSFQFGQPASSQTNGFGSGGNTGFSFGQQNGDATPKANVFSIHEDQQTPTATNPFGAVQPSATLFAAPSTNGFNFTNSNAQSKPADTTSTTFSGFGSTTATTPAPAAAAAAASKPAGDGWTSFLNKPTETPKPATNGFTFGATSTNTTQTNGASTPSLFNGFGAQNKTPSFKFTAQPDDDASMMSPESTPQKPATNGTFSQAESAPKTSNPGSLFDRITKPVDSNTVQPTPSFFPAANSASVKDTAQSSEPKPQESARPSPFPPSAPTPAKDNSQSSQSLFTKPAATAPQGNLFASQPSAKAQSASSTPASATASQSTLAAKKTTSMNTTNPQHFDSIRELNEGLLQHLQTQDLTRDLSTIFDFYAQEIKKITSTQPASNGFGSSILGKPISQSNVADTATSKSSEPLYPKLPDNASSTAKIFEAALDAPAAGTAGNSTFGTKSQTTSGASSLFTAQPGGNSTTPASSLFAKSSAAPSASLFAPKPADSTSSSNPLFANKPAGEIPQSSSLFAPKPAVPQDKPAGFTPSKPMGFTPTTAATGSFLSSFGEQAEKNAAAEKKRRRDEDFDSDEDNEAEWEKRDAEEQAAKRSKIAEAAKNATGFTFKPAATSTTASAASTSLFSFKPAEAKKNEPAAAPPAEDHTWKQGTPIKFGANSTDSTSTPAPKFSFLNAATPSTAPSLFANIQKPTNNFTFGPASATPAAGTATQSASTPAAANDTTETNSAEGGDAEPPLTQLDDLAVLLPSELEESDILYQVDKSKSKKLESRPSEGGTEKLTWVDKGHGPIWILKNKSTGKTRVLQKVKDSGRVAMNFSLLPGNENYYKHEGMTSGKAVKATFIDHLAKNAGPSQWMIIVGQKDDAAQIARILRDEQSKL